MKLTLASNFLLILRGSASQIQAWPPNLISKLQWFMTACLTQAHTASHKHTLPHTGKLGAVLNLLGYTRSQVHLVVLLYAVLNIYTLVSLLITTTYQVLKLVNYLPNLPFSKTICKVIS